MADRVDVLNRNMFIEQLWSIVKILSRKRRGCCFGIDGAWGSGISFMFFTMTAGNMTIMRNRCWRL